MTKPITYDSDPEPTFCRFCGEYAGPAGTVSECALCTARSEWAQEPTEAEIDAMTPTNVEHDAF